MIELWELLTAIILALIASSGFWGIVLYRIQNKDGKKENADNLTKLVLGLAHQEIIRTCMLYVQRGYITKDEYEDMFKYLYDPYRALGGNGTAEKIISEVEKLPMK